jgi:hypothetical protein
VKTESDEEVHLEQKRKYSKISSDTTPLGIHKNVTGPSGLTSSERFLFSPFFLMISQALLTISPR